MVGADSGVYAAGDETACATDSAIPRGCKAGNENAEFDFEYSGARRNRRKVSGCLRIDGGCEHAGAVDAAGICVSAIPGQTAKSRAGGFAGAGAGESIGRPRSVAAGVNRRSDDFADQEEYVRVEDVNVSVKAGAERRAASPPFSFGVFLFCKTGIRPRPGQGHYKDNSR